MADIEFLIPRPAETDGDVTRETHDQHSTTARVYRTEAGKQLKWSAAFPLPQIGDRVRITMNNIGEAEVMGFFKEGGWVGVMTKALQPPKWLQDQRDRERRSKDFNTLPAWRKDGIGCEFGAEIALL